MQQNRIMWAFKSLVIGALRNGNLKLQSQPKDSLRLRLTLDLRAPIGDFLGGCSRGTFQTLAWIVMLAPEGLKKNSFKDQLPKQLAVSRRNPRLDPKPPAPNKNHFYLSRLSPKCLVHLATFSGQTKNSEHTSKRAEKLP